MYSLDGDYDVVKSNVQALHGSYEYQLGHI